MNYIQINRELRFLSVESIQKCVKLHTLKDYQVYVSVSLESKFLSPRVLILSNKNSENHEELIWSFKTALPCLITQNILKSY